MGLFGKKLELPTASQALPGRSERMPTLRHIEIVGAHRKEVKKIQKNKKLADVEKSK